MTVIKKSAVVPYTAEQMYELVNDVRSYPEFLPWCEDAAVIAHEDRRMRASISMASHHVHHKFTTENILQPGRRIDVRLVEGPFRHLHGYWLFEPAGENCCRTTLEMDFEFKNRIIRLALSGIFHHIVNSLVDSFTQRARQVHGDA